MGAKFGETGFVAKLLIRLRLFSPTSCFNETRQLSEDGQESPRTSQSALMIAVLVCQYSGRVVSKDLLV